MLRGKCVRFGILEVLGCQSHCFQLYDVLLQLLGPGARIQFVNDMIKVCHVPAIHDCCNIQEHHPEGVYVGGLH